MQDKTLSKHSLLSQPVVVSSHVYSDAIFSKKIVLLGPCPPPFGGIAIHIKRVMRKLLKQGNTVFYFDTIQLWSLFISHLPRYVPKWFLLRYPFECYLLSMILFLIKKRPDIVYYHTLFGNGPCEWYVLWWCKVFLQFKLVIVEHDPRYLDKKNINFKKHLRYFLTVADQMVFIGNTTYEGYQKNGIQYLQKFSIEEAFLPPFFEEREDILKKYSPTLIAFMNNHKPLISMSAFSLVLLKNKDLYGIDQATDLMERLTKIYPLTGLVCALAKKDPIKRYEKILKNLKDKNLLDKIYFFTENVEMWPIIEKSDLFIRPVLNENSGIVVSEALAVKTPVVASDVCVRPRGTVLYDVQSFEEFFHLINKMLKKIKYD